MATAAQGMNPAYLLDPSLYGDQQAISQQQALAQALMSQGISPMGDTQMAGQVALRNSPTQSIAKLVQILSGQDMQRQANVAGQALMQRQAQAIMPMFQPQMSGLPPQQAALAAGGQGPTNAAAQSAQTMPGPTMTPGPWTIPGSTGPQSLSAYLLNPEKFGEVFAGGLAPNDTTKMAMQGGMDPQAANRLALQKAQMDPKIFAMKQAGMSDAQINAAVLGEAAKNAEISRRPKEAFSNMVTGESGMVGQIPEGANVTGPPGPNGQVSLSPMPGNSTVLANNSAATTAGNNSQTPAVSYGPDGRPVQTTRGRQVAQANGHSDIAAIDFDISKERDPAVKAQLIQSRNKIAAAQGDALLPEQAPGVVTGANDAQKQLGDRFGALRDNVTQAQTTNSYLESIKQLSDKAATGKFSDRVDYLNAVLATAGISDRASDAKTANDLLAKYSSQIVSRLGSNTNLGTDSARTILGQAYPNAHMTREAISEAVDNIKAVNEMQKAKLSYLAPAGNSRDATTYQQREQQFDQIADPRIWQYKSIADPALRKAFAQRMQQADPQIGAKITALEKMGVL